MSRNVFLSFLGISNYLPVRYYLEDEGKKDHHTAEKFVQKSLLDYLSASFSSDDLAIIFLTPQARKSNWNSDKPDQDLEPHVLGKYPFKVKPVDIGDEASTEAVHKTFMAIYDALQPGDNIYLDITHSWRYLPLLGATLLSYAKALKSVQVSAIYYGALERLGNHKEVEQIPEEERWVPILNFVRFSELEDWASAAREFVDYGNPDRWIDLVTKEINPVLKESGGNNEQLKMLSKVNRLIKLVSMQITTNRGQELLEFKFKEFDKMIREVSDASGLSYKIQPLKPILELVGKKVSPFANAGLLGWLEAVRWSLQHNLIQQGFTQMQEGILTWLCTRFRRMGIYPEFFDWKKESPRNFLSSLLNLVGEDIPESDWRGDLAKNKDIAHRILVDPIIKTIAPHFKALTNTRNDINHGGYTRNTKPAKFKDGLEQIFNELEPILKAEEEKLAEGRRFLLNLSNHPFEQWEPQQQQIALEKYGRVEDMKFPEIPADHNEEEVAELTENYLLRILEKNPSAVHLMGEMTFTFTLVAKLKANGMPCIASTSTRNVVEHGDGRKEVLFRFVRFRDY